MKLLLQVFEKINNLRLNGYIQGRNGLIADNQGRIYAQCPCHSHPLPLSAAEFMGITIRD